MQSRGSCTMAFFPPSARMWAYFALNPWMEERVRCWRAVEGRAELRVLHPWRNVDMYIVCILPGNARKAAEYSGHIVPQ